MTHNHVLLKSTYKGLKDYKCESCAKSFYDAQHLKRHIQAVHEKTKITNVNLVENHFLKQEI